MTREEKAISFFEDMNECTYGNLEAVNMAIKALKAMSQIYKITGGYAEALYQSETTFDGVAGILTDYFKVLEDTSKALEQEPCEDAVSRKEVFEGLNSLNGTAELDMAFEVIEKLPSVTPIHRDSTVQDFADKCRECGREKVFDKISAEIEALEEGIISYHNDRPWIFKDEVLQIIAKYKAERR